MNPNNIFGPAENIKKSFKVLVFVNTTIQGAKIWQKSFYPELNHFKRKFYIDSEKDFCKLIFKLREKYYAHKIGVFFTLYNSQFTGEFCIKTQSVNNYVIFQTGTSYIAPLGDYKLPFKAGYSYLIQDENGNPITTNIIANNDKNLNPTTVIESDHPDNFGKSEYGLTISKNYSIDHKTFDRIDESEPNTTFLIPSETDTKENWDKYMNKSLDPSKTYCWSSLGLNSLARHLTTYYPNTYLQQDENNPIQWNIIQNTNIISNNLNNSIPLGQLYLSIGTTINSKTLNTTISPISLTTSPYVNLNGIYIPTFT